MAYRIREVDASDEDIAEVIHEFNKVEARWPALSDDELDGHNCFWWLAYDDERTAVGFAGLVPSQRYPNAGYLKRAWVAETARGSGLQGRFLRARALKARRIGWKMLVTETTDALHSANNLMKNGYRLFEPYEPWAFPNSLYWRKEFT